MNIPNIKQLPARAWMALVAVGCIAMLVYGIVYLQNYLGLVPCPMCIVQRYALIGVIVLSALGALGGGPLNGALMQGFAVISSDAGHTGPQTPFFGLEPQARLDYGYQAVAKLTPIA